MPRITSSWILVLFAALYIALVLYGSASGVRGTDQYWYVADIQTLANHQPPLSNNLYPPSALSQSSPALEARPFIHNTPYVYLAAIAAKTISPFHSAILLNTLSYLIASLLIFLSMRRLGIEEKIAALTTGLFLLFPMNYWLSVNAMSEALLVPGIAFLAYLATNKSITVYTWILSIVCLLFLILTRESMVILALLLPFFYVLEKRELTLKTLAIFITLTSGFIVAYWLRASLLPHNESCSFPEMVRRMTPGVSDNMFCYFNLQETAINPSLWIEKIMANFTKQVKLENSISWSFYLPTNILVISGFIGALRTRNHLSSFRLGALLFALLMVHLATMIVIENLPRYLVILPPVALILSTLLVTNIRQQYRKFAILAFVSILTASVAADLLAANKVRHEAEQEARQVTQIQDIAHHYIKNSKIALAETDQGDNMCLLSYALEPHMVLFTRSQYPTEVTEQLLRKTHPDYAILKDSSLLVHQPPASLSLQALTRMPPPFESHALYKIIYALEKQ